MNTTPYATQGEAITAALEAGGVVAIDEAFHDLIDRGYVVRFPDREVDVLRRVATHYQWFEVAGPTEGVEEEPLWIVWMVECMDGPARNPIFCGAYRSMEAAAEAVDEYGDRSGLASEQEDGRLNDCFEDGYEPANVVESSVWMLFEDDATQEPSGAIWMERTTWAG